MIDKDFLKRNIGSFANMLAMLLIIISRENFDWLALSALILFIASLGVIIYNYIKLNNLK